MEHVFIYEKGKITVTGVTKLENFEDKEAVIRLENNTLVVKGTDFVLQEMTVSAKKVCFLGKMTSMEYVNKVEKSLIKRLFK